MDQTLFYFALTCLYFRLQLALFQIFENLRLVVPLECEFDKFGLVFTQPNICTKSSASQHDHLENHYQKNYHDNQSDRYYSSEKIPLVNSLNSATNHCFITSIFSINYKRHWEAAEKSLTQYYKVVLRIDSGRKLTQIPRHTQNTLSNPRSVVEIGVEQVVLRRHLKVNSADKV